MADPLQRRAELVVKLVFLALALAVAGFLVLTGWRQRSFEPVGEPVAQPIPFSHKHHVGDVGIDCRYCHTTVETSAFAGLPSTGICLSCHSQLFKDQPMLAPLHESVASGKPIAWQRVHQLPDFVFFDHSVHLARGVACIECHGRLDQMALTWRVAPLQMQWCVACHRDPAPHLHPHAQLTAMPPSRVGEAETADLLRLLNDQRRRTDCSTCHR